MATYSTRLPRRFKSWRVFYHHLVRNRIIRDGIDWITFVDHPDISVQLRVSIAPMEEVMCAEHHYYTVQFLRDKLLDELLVENPLTMFSMEEFRKLLHCIYSYQHAGDADYIALARKVKTMYNQLRKED